MTHISITRAPIAPIMANGAAMPAVRHFDLNRVETVGYRHRALAAVPGHHRHSLQRGNHEMGARLERFAAALNAAKPRRELRSKGAQPIHRPSPGFLTAFSNG